MKVSAAKLALLPSCSYWARDEIPAPPVQSSEPADTGKATHSLIEVSQLGGMPEIPELADVNKAGKLFATWQPWWKTYGGDRPWRYEIPLLYDWEAGTAREMPRDWVSTGRERRATEIPAIVDALSNATILDWKTGAKREASKDSWQLRIAALAAHLLYGWPSIDVGLVYLRIRKIDDPELATYDALDLLSFADEIRRLMLGRSISQPVPGGHCFRCALRQRGDDGEVLCPGLRMSVGFDEVFGTGNDNERVSE